MWIYAEMLLGTGGVETAVGEDLPHIGNCRTADPRRTHAIFLFEPVRLRGRCSMPVKLSSWWTTSGSISSCEAELG